MVVTSGTREWCYRNVNVYNGCSCDCLYCLHPETIILMEDLSEKKLKDIHIGDKIIGIKKSKGNRYSITNAVVLKKWENVKFAYRIVLEDNTELICSKDHRWLSDRDWKYTIGEMTGLYRRPYLTTNNSLKKLYDLSIQKKETSLYKRGYLSGMIRGDAHLKIHHIKNKKGGSKNYQFRLALIDNDALIRTKEYLNDLGVKTFNFIFTDKMNGIRTNKSMNYERIKHIIQYDLNPEYLRGFVAGLFDAEGSNSRNIMRIYNKNRTIIKYFKSGLKAFDFDFVEELSKRDIISIRLKGNRSERIRFFQLYNPVVERKRKVPGIIKKESKIKEISSLNKRIEMIDIETSSGNFIANGCISHNCYAKRNAIRFNRKTNETWSLMELNEKVYNKKFKKVQNTNPELFDYMFNSSHNITSLSLGPCLHVLEKILHANNTVLITTKPFLNCIIAICHKFVKYKDLIQFRFTITSLNDDTLKKWEPNAPNFNERFLSLKFAYAMDYKTSISIEPFLDMDPIPLIKSLFPYVSNTIWIGKLNYFKTEFNSWKNIQTVISNIQNLSKNIKEKIQIKDSIVNEYNKRGLEIEL